MSSCLQRLAAQKGNSSRIDECKPYPFLFRWLRKKRPPGTHAHITPSRSPDLNIDGGSGDRPSCAKTGVFFAASGTLRGIAILKPGVRGGRETTHPFQGAGVFFAVTGTRPRGHEGTMCACVRRAEAGRQAGRNAGKRASRPFQSTLASILLAGLPHPSCITKCTRIATKRRVQLGLSGPPGPLGLSGPPASTLHATMHA